MQPEQRICEAVIWETPSSAGKRVTVTAENLDDARLQLEEEFGKGTVFDLHSESHASMPR